MVEGARAERVLRLDPDQERGWFDAPDYSEGNKRVPLVGLVQNVDVKEAELAARVQHVLTFLTEQQQDMLLGYYVEGRTLKELSRDGERKQSVHERLAWARNAFLKAWVQHAEDELTLHGDDL
jgi:DNA-directed RNA polymerase specialized sigma24 family protein